MVSSSAYQYTHFFAYHCQQTNESMGTTDPYRLRNTITHITSSREEEALAVVWQSRFVLSPSCRRFERLADNQSDFSYQELPAKVGWENLEPKIKLVTRSDFFEIQQIGATGKMRRTVRTVPALFVGRGWASVAFLVCSSLISLVVGELNIGIF